jgi:hypothetical protein
MSTGAFMGESIGRVSVSYGLDPVQDIMIESGINATRSSHRYCFSVIVQPSGTKSITEMN